MLRRFLSLRFRVNEDVNMNKFANLWPDELDTTAPLRDLGYAPDIKLPDMVARVIAAHEERNENAAAAFQAIDEDGSNELSRSNLEAYIRKYEVGGRETYKRTGQMAVGDVIDKLMKEIGDDSGSISWQAFSEWNRSNSIDELLAGEQEA